MRFLGFVYAQAARQLFANCYIYVQPSVVEGNSPASFACHSRNYSSTLPLVGFGAAGGVSVEVRMYSMPTMVAVG